MSEARLDLQQLSQRELRRRLRELWDATCHLRHTIPVDNPHAATFTTWDLARFLGEHHRHLLEMRLETPPPRCTFACPDVNSCRLHRRCRMMQPYLQRRLSDFFRRWDAGALIKARVGDQYQVIAVAKPEFPTQHPTLAPLAAAPRAQADPGRTIALTIDRRTLGLKVGR